MSDKLTPEDSSTLESMIDRSSLGEVLRVIAEICNGKAEHIQTNWQDRPLAQDWARMSGRCDALADESYRKNI